MRATLESDDMAEEAEWVVSEGLERLDRLDIVDMVPPRCRRMVPWFLLLDTL